MKLLGIIKFLPPTKMAWPSTTPPHTFFHWAWAHVCERKAYQSAPNDSMWNKGPSECSPEEPKFETAKADNASYLKSPRSDRHMPKHPQKAYVGQGLSPHLSSSLLWTERHTPIKSSGQTSALVRYFALRRFAFRNNINMLVLAKEVTLTFLVETNYFYIWMDSTLF